MSNKYSSAYLYLCVLVPIIGFTPMVNAQDFAIEEIIVTAQKRKESLQDIPLAVTAISGETLREDGVADLGDLGDRVPGLVFSPYSNAQPEIAIRGIGTKEDGPAANDSTVISIDDVYIAARSAQVFDLYDLERVEVLRGPQGTLYGKNSIGGSINFVTSKPTETLAGRVSVTLGNFGQRDIGGLISGPISESFLSKLSFSKRDMDGYFDNVLINKDEGAIDTLAARWQSLWVPGSGDIEITLTADWAKDDNENHSRQPLGLPSVTTNSNPQLVSRAFGDPGDDPHKSTSDEIGYFKRTIKGFSTKVDWSLSNFTLTSVTAWRESEFDWLFDLNGVPGGPSTGSPEDGFGGDASNLIEEDTRQLTQELRAASSGANSGGFDWIVGIFFSDEYIARDEKVCFRNCGLGVVFQAPLAPTPGLIINGSDQTNDATAWAIYGQTIWNLSEKSNLTGGLRYSTERKDVDIAGARDFGLFDFGIVVSPSGSPASWRITDSTDWNNVSGRLALDYQIADSAMLYGSVSTGFKSGGYTGTASTPERALTPFDEEQAINYEVGLKSKWLKNTLRLNMSAFYTDYKDLQVTRFYRPATNPDNTIGEFATENAAAATIQGLEVEWLWLLANNWEFGGNYAYLDAEFDDFTPATANLDIDTNNDDIADSCGVGSSTGAVVNGEQGCIPDFSGNQLRQAPRNSGSTYLKYIFNTASWIWSVKTSYRFQSEVFFDPDNNDLTTTPSYSVWDVHLGWISKDGTWNVSAWGKNITDEQYRTQIFSTTGGTRAFFNPGNPRTYGITTAYSL